MHWPAFLLIPLRLAAMAAGAYLLVSSIDAPDWMPASHEYARAWRERLEQSPDPEAVQSRHREVVLRRFDDGSWIVGVCRESLGIQDGGAVIVRDSLGRSRVLFGQGCASSTLRDILADSSSIEAFVRHETWTMLQFKEHELP